MFTIYGLVLDAEYHVKWPLNESSDSKFEKRSKLFPQLPQADSKLSAGIKAML